MSLYPCTHEVCSLYSLKVLCVIISFLSKSLKRLKRSVHFLYYWCWAGEKVSQRLSPLSLASHYQPFFFLSAMHGITQPPYQGSSHYSLAILFHRLPPPLSFYLSITIMPRAYILMGINAAELSVLGVRGLIASYLPSAVRMYHGRLSLRGTISTSSFIIRWDSALLHDDLHTCDFILSIERLTERFTRT